MKKTVIIYLGVLFSLIVLASCGCKNESTKNSESTEASSITKDDLRAKCSDCNGSGTCSICAGTGIQACMNHDSNGNGTCFLCDNKMQYQCASCWPAGQCKKCDGEGYY